MGVATGLVTLWYVAPVLAPELAEGPLARAFVALGLASLGAVVAYVVLVIVTRTWPGGRGANRR
jgi:hypothetical protein